MTAAGAHPECRQLAEASTRHLSSLYPPSDDGVWLQNADLFHSTLFHASTHQDPRTASPEEVEAEAQAVAEVARLACPLRVVLERVVATSSGAVVACWQIVGGTDPSQLREALAGALPRSSPQQAVRDTEILHTTLARLVKLPPVDPAATARGRRRRGLLRRPPVEEAAAAVLQEAVRKMTQDLCGLEATLDTLWCGCCCRVLSVPPTDPKAGLAGCCWPVRARSALRLCGLG